MLKKNDGIRQFEFSFGVNIWYVPVYLVPVHFALHKNSVINRCLSTIINLD
ncbi:MAG: hypothetical protein KJ737_18415 [Proteobacteria bacterium]|nr:hypothetical protein [Pseudomonadota bacterium]